ncbi:MAG: acetylxylan esterase [Kiritimatiellae bacterium]|nr:acetylxylan esterase [Kiritimatiellia bacterium]
MMMTMWESLARRTEAMAANAFDGVASIDDWERERPIRRREFLSALGLGTLPERCDLAIREYGTFAGEGYGARKIGFQLLPDCWSSAVIYYPDPAPPGSAPGVLYTCGHNTHGVWGYHPHPMMWARRGYVCLILNTIEQADHPGEHHGANLSLVEAWVAMGYSSAGGEAWNSIRALDVLARDPRVDPERLGVTGVSGGGAASFFLAAIDERVKAVSSLCGISTPVDAVRNRHLQGHCDCMYALNLYRRDWSEYAALIAPRGAMFCFADHDALFHPAQTRAFVERTAKIYALYGKPEMCRLVTCPGKHGNHPEFDAATAPFFDEHVASEKRPAVECGPRKITEHTTSVFNGAPPAPNRLDMLPRLLSPRGAVPYPAEPDEWPAIRKRAIESLPFPLDDGCPARLRLDGDWRRGRDKDELYRSHRGEVDGVEVWLHLVNPAGHAPKVVVGVANAGESSLHGMAAVVAFLEQGAAAYGGFEPRAAGDNMPVDLPDSAPPGSRPRSGRTRLVRAMALTGLTPALMTFYDTGVLVDYLLQLEELKGCEIYLHGRNAGAVAVLYRGIVDERVAGVFLEDLPSSHLYGGSLPGILRAFDIPHAVGLIAPRKVALINPGHNFWTWPATVYERLGCPERYVTSGDLRRALNRLL